MKWICSRRKCIGTEIVHIPFRQLQLIIDVECLMLRDDNRFLLFMKDIVGDGLDISMEHNPVILGDHIHKMSMENYLLVHRWSPTYVPFAMHTESKLIQIHKSFVHPSIRSTKTLTKRATR